MLALTFLHPGLLWLLPLVAVPIVIHILNRRRFQRVRWAAMEFLLAALRRNRRRLQVQQWLLLALRTLAALALVLLVTRPQLGTAFGRTRVHHVMCVDDSLSMAHRRGTRDAWADAIDALLARAELLARDARGDLLTLLLTSAPERPLLATMQVGSGLAARVRDALQQARRGDGIADVAATLRQAVDLDREQDTGARLEITLLSDLRQHDWLSDDGKPRPDVLAAILDMPPAEEARLTLHAVGSRDSDNLAVTDVRLRNRVVAAGVPAQFAVDVSNLGIDATAPTELTVRITAADGTTSAQLARPVPALQPGETVAVDVEQALRDAGDVGVLAHLPDDAFAPDDRRALVVPVPAALRCLLVDGAPGRSTREDETFFLAAVLDPQLEVRTGLEPVVIPEQALVDEDLAQADLLWLANLPAPTAELATRLRAFVDGGGGLVISVGSQVDGARYADVLGAAGLLPATIGDVAGDLDQPRPAFLATPEHPLVAGEGELLAGLLPLVLVGRYMELLPPDEAASPPVLRVGDAGGPPLLVAAQAGNAASGRIVLLGTTVDDAWTSLPTDFAYPVLVHEICGWAMRPVRTGVRTRTSTETWREPHDVGRFRPDLIVRALGEVDAIERTFTARELGEPAPDGEPAAAEVAVAMNELAGFGLFAVTRTGHDLRPDPLLLARNAPLQESRLQVLSGAAVQRAFPEEARSRMRVIGGAEAGEQAEGGGGLAALLAAALLLALLAESWLAFRTSR